MFARLHDQGLGVFLRLASDIGKLVNRQIGQVVECVYATVGQLADQFRRQPFQVTQVLRPAVAGPQTLALEPGVFLQ